MGRKKKKQSKPWCWYCNREFDDEKILIQHQKAKHFKCHICHKKLFTGPGLSIHCMQVHKEAIDKVPNSMPTRSNIEIEIYGMEGIPPEDLKEHEKQKQGRAGSPSSGEDEPPPKKRAEGSGLMPGGPSMVPQGYPPMGPMMSHMGPMPPFMPPGMGMMPGGPMGPSMPAPHLQNKPLFPSAAAITSSSGHSSGIDTKSTSTATIGPVKPTFPAYSSGGGSGGGSTSSSSDSGKVNMVAAVGGSSKIIHPPEDISLEEYLSRLPKYKGPTGGGGPQAGNGGDGTPAPTEETPSSPATSQAPPTAPHQAPIEHRHPQPQPPTSLSEERRMAVNRMPVGVSAGMLPPVSGVAIMTGACPPLIRAAPPSIPILQASMPLLRPHQAMQLHPGLMMPQGMAYPAGPPVFPGGPHVLAPMMPPRFR